MGMIWEGRALTAEEAAELVSDPEQLWELDGGEPPVVVDLDKAWHGIHWLLTGEVWGGSGPLASAILGGEEFGDDDGSSARLLSAEQVRAVHDALAGVGDDILRARFDGLAMSAAEIYPDIWDESGVVDEYLLPNLASLRALYEHAAGKGLVVIQSVG